MDLKLKRAPGIYLVGFMGCGKSTVGRALAEEIGWNFSDLDEDIERIRGLAIPQIFDTLGEAVFRQVETAALIERVASVRSGRPHVVALGGGAFSTGENRDLVLAHGVTVWLDCPYATIERRVAAATHRPLARDPVALRKLFDIRRASYERADFRIEVPGDDPRDGVARILALPLF